MDDTEPWTADDLPDLSGKTIAVTGGNSGIGYEAALQFAHKGAKVVLACRSMDKARAAAAAIGAAHPGAASREGNDATNQGLEQHCRI